jgi:phage gp29-like protein
MATAPKALYNEQAIDYLLSNLLQMADTDETLKKLGIHRKELRTLESDDEIYAAIETRREALIATPWRLESGLASQNTFLWTEIERVIATVLRGAFNAVLYGYSVQEVIYKNTHGKITLAEISEKPFEWFEPKSNGDLIYRSMLDPMGTAVDTDYKFLLTVRNQTYRQPYGEAVLSRLYWAWLFRVNGWKFWAKNLERAGIPFLKGTAPDMPMADGTPSVDHLSVVLNAAVQNATLALPAGWEAEFMSVQQNGATFEQFENAILKRIQKVILGQTLTSDVGKAGSFAAAKVHQAVLDDRRKADMRLVTKTVQTLVTALHTLNSFTGEPPTFVMEDDTGLETERADRDSKLVQAGVLKLTPDYLLRVYDYEEGDFEIPAELPNQTINPPIGGKKFSAADNVFAPIGARISENPLPMGGRESFNFYAPMGARFTSAQQEIENLADNALENSSSPISEGAIFNAIKTAKSPEDLADKLAVLFADTDTAQFRQMLERAMFAADVLGYVNA